MTNSVSNGFIVFVQILFVFKGLFFNTQACSHTVNSTEAGIYSPGYPDMQDGLVTCSWVIIGDEHHVLLFKIRDMYIPSTSSTNCTQNYIHFSMPDKRYCGLLINQVPIVYTSTSAFLSLKYYNTGIPRPGKGFAIDFFKVPKSSSSHAPCAEGYFFCRNDQYCISTEWLQNGVNECTDGSDEVITTPVTEKSTILTVTTPKPKFIRCSKTFTALSGNFHTPNYPHIYPHQSNCEWLIEVKKDQKLQLYFMDFRLGNRDTVTVYDGIKLADNVIGEYTENGRPEDLIQSTGNRLYVEFKSFSIAAGNGFNATYQVKGFCKSDGWFNCGYGEDLCYYKNLRCDGIWHCKTHGGDERNCGKCPPEKFECSSGSSQCYTEADRCNGQGHCVDNADEMKCSSEKCGPSNGTFLCHNQRCIIESWTCDGANDCGDNSDELHCSTVASRKVITAAVVGAILCALLLVIALGCTCRLHAMRMRDIMGHNYVSPVSRVQQEIWARRSAPPLYDEAMQMSRPYDEMVAVIEQAFRNRSSNNRIDNNTTSDDELLIDGNDVSDSAALSARAGNMSDDDILDLGESDGNDNGDTPNVEDSIGASNVEITLSAGATAQWRRSQGIALNSNGTKIRKNVTLVLKMNDDDNDDDVEESAKASPSNNNVSIGNNEQFELRNASVDNNKEQMSPAVNAIDQNVIKISCDNDFTSNLFDTGDEHQQQPVCLLEQSQDPSNESQILNESLNQKCNSVDLPNEDNNLIASTSTISVQNMSNISENNKVIDPCKRLNDGEKDIGQDYIQVALEEENDFDHSSDDTVPLI